MAVATYFEVCELLINVALSILQDYNTFFILSRTYVVMSGKEVEPGTPFKVVVTLFKSAKKSSDMDSHFYYSSATIHAKILRMGTVIAEEERACQPGTTEIIAIKVNAGF